MEAFDAEVSITVSEVSSDDRPVKRPRTHRRRRKWVMLDRVLGPLEDGNFTRYASFTDLTEGITSAGEKIVVAFRAVEPPKTSRIFYKLHLNNPKCIWLNEASAVAADGDCILLRFFIIDDSYNIRRRTIMREEFFIYRASPLALTNLPRCGHKLINFDGECKIGILCYNDGEFAVAHLTVTTKRRCSGQRVAVDLCCVSSKDLQWRTTKSVPILNAEGQDHLIWWETDTVVAFDQHLCFVDYLRGVLFYDVSRPIPQLYYAPLPVDPYLDDIDSEADGRGPLSAYRSVCVTKDGLKFVDVEYNGCWFYPAHWHVPYAVSTWTMSMTKPNYEWVKDSCMEVEELDAIIKQHNLPRSQLRFPLVDRKKPELIYFALEEVDKCICGETYLVVVDMRNKVLANVVHYTSGGFESLKDNVCNDTFSLNLAHCIEFLPCEFYKRLDQDEPHGRRPRQHLHQHGAAERQPLSSVRTSEQEAARAGSAAGSACGGRWRSRLCVWQPAAEPEAACARGAASSVCGGRRRSTRRRTHLCVWLPVPVRGAMVAWRRHLRPRILKKRDKDVGGSIEVPESSTLRPQKHGSPTTP